MPTKIVKCGCCGKEMGFNQAYKCDECDGLACQDCITAGTCELCFQDGYLRPESESKPNDNFEAVIQGWDEPFTESGKKCERCESMDAIDCTVWDETQADGYLHTNLCAEHAEDEGHCIGCGTFCAGMTSYDFYHHGWCDNCWDEISSGDVDEDDLDDY